MNPDDQELSRQIREFGTRHNAPDSLRAGLRAVGDPEAGVVAAVGRVEQHGIVEGGEIVRPPVRALPHMYVPWVPLAAISAI